MKKNYNSHLSIAENLSRKSRSRQELAEAYGISPRTFRRWLKLHHLILPSGLVRPTDIKRIFKYLGPPGG